MALSYPEMYYNARPLNDLYTSRVAVKSVLWVTGSQYTDLSTGLIWSYCSVLYRLSYTVFVKTRPLQ